MSLARSRWIALWITGSMLIGGCISDPQHPTATQPSTVINRATTQPSYWLDQPAVAVVNSSNFDAMWKACEDVARDYFFKLDREDYRSGVLTTEPMISAQFFEPWRRDTRTMYDLKESSWATIRRSIRFEFTRRDDQTWDMTPKILVERATVVERRITSVVSYHGVFSPPSKSQSAFGSREADEGFMIQARYWYPLRRDDEFEKVIAKSVQDQIGKH